MNWAREKWQDLCFDCENVRDLEKRGSCSQTDTVGTHIEIFTLMNLTSFKLKKLLIFDFYIIMRWKPRSPSLMIGKWSSRLVKQIDIILGPKFGTWYLQKHYPWNKDAYTICYVFVTKCKIISHFAQCVFPEKNNFSLVQTRFFKIHFSKHRLVGKNTLNISCSNLNLTDKPCKHLYNK